MQVFGAFRFGVLMLLLPVNAFPLVPIGHPAKKLRLARSRCLVLSKNADPAPAEHTCVQNRLYLATRRQLFAALVISAPAVRANADVDDGSNLDAVKSKDLAFLRARLAGGEVQQLSNAGPFSSNQLYYPPWVFGEYQVSSMLQKKTFPAGTKFIPPRMQSSGTLRSTTENVGDVITMPARYFSTLPDTWDNNLRVNLGLGMPSASIIEDRSYNALQASAAVASKDKPQATDAAYDPRTDAQLLTLFFSDEKKKKAEVRVTNRMSSSESDYTWLASESFQLKTTTGDGQFAEEEYYEQIMELNLLENGNINGKQRTVVYLPPSNALWRQVRGQAVAIYDYDLVFRRKLDEDGSVCVDTPKGFRQCQPPIFRRA